MGRDKSTRAEIAIGYEHHEIHGGSHFFIEDHATLASAATIDFGIQTANSSKHLHIVWDIQSQAEFLFDIYEGSTITFDGADIEAFNNDRNSSNVTNLVQLQMDPTVTAVGTRLGGFDVGTATNPATQIPGAGNRDREIILASNTIYLFRITSAANDNTISYLAEWYEHTVKS